jgi:iron complex outermembrane receptor protein
MFCASCALAVGLAAAAAPEEQQVAQSGGGAAPAAAAESDAGDTLIITGTRVGGTKAIESSAPIEVLSPAAIENSGEQNLLEAMVDLAPSFSAVTSTDYGAIVLSPQLRGLPSGEVLVLINGKRLHPSAYVDTGGQDGGTNPVDMEFIPPAMIDHVEILQSGAAAQYGSDAIAGVINLILKNYDSGTTLETLDGITSRGDGGRQSINVDKGFKLGDNGGFLNVDLYYWNQDYFTRDDGVPLKTASACINGVNVGLGHNNSCEILNRGAGSPTYSTYGFNSNMGIPLGEIDFYAFNELGYRTSSAYEGYRVPSTAPYAYPTGFIPHEDSQTWDWSFTEGLKGKLGQWKWDVSNTWGHSRFNQSEHATINTGYQTLLKENTFASFVNQTPGQISMGAQEDNQVVTNADINRDFDIAPLAAPLNVALGLEHRFETYEQLSGNPLSYLYGGTQAFSGFPPQIASSSSRQVGAAYVDLSTKILPQWSVDLAGRFEEYGDSLAKSESGRLSTRYEFGPWLAVRANVSDGFHAPTLAQENFGVANVAPITTGAGQAENFTIIQPVTSPGASVLGAPALKPEKAKDLSLGLVSQLSDSLSATVDIYQVYIENRIGLTGAIGNQSVSSFCSATCVANGNALAAAAAAANGFSVPPGSTIAGEFFTNIADTWTRGVDFNLAYKQSLGDFGSLRWDFSGNENITYITKQLAPSATLAAAGLSNFNPQVITNIQKLMPINKYTLAGTWSLGRFDFTVRETRWGHLDDVITYGTPTKYYNLFEKSQYITNLVVSYKITDDLKVQVGANNVFDRFPTQVPFNPIRSANARQTPTYPYSPWGLDGMFAFGHVVWAF